MRHTPEAGAVCGNSARTDLRGGRGVNLRPYRNNMTIWPRVELVTSYAGASGAVVDALLAPNTNPSVTLAPLRGLVVAGTGNGTVHKDLESALLRAQAQGIKVVRATRCAAGRVLSAPPGGSVRRFEDSQGLSPVKARIALMLALLAN